MSRTIWSGRKDQGGRDYTDGEYLAVVAYVRECRGERNAVPLVTIERDTGIAGRTIRSVLSVADCEAGLVLGYISEGATRLVFVAEFRDEVDRHTATMEAQVATMVERIRRRHEIAATLPEREPDLFGRSA
jgi:protein subunit release factor B